VLKDGTKRTYGREFGCEATAIAENGKFYGISTLSWTLKLSQKLSVQGE
jgi:hypothetical protein